MAASDGNCARAPELRASSAITAIAVLILNMAPPSSFLAVAGRETAIVTIHLLVRASSAFQLGLPRQPFAFEPVELLAQRALVFEQRFQSRRILIDGRLAEPRLDLR